MELAGKRVGELGVADRIGCGEVDRPGEGGAVEQEEDRGYQVWEADPGDPLPARAEAAAQAKTEDWNHSSKSSGRGLGAQCNAKAKMDDADAGINGGLGCGFPLMAEVGKKSRAGGGRLVKHLGAAVAVDAGCR